MLVSSVRGIACHIDVGYIGAVRHDGQPAHQHTKQSVVNRVLHCAETIKGGIASYLRDLIACQARDFGASNISVVIPVSHLNELPLPPGVQVFTFENSAGRAINAVRLAKAVFMAVRATEADVVHVHSTFAGVTVRPTLWLAGQSHKVVYCPHGWAWDRQQSGLVQWGVKAIERLLAPMAARIICISEHERSGALAAGFAPSRLQVVLNGIAEQFPTPSPVNLQWRDGKKRVLFVGRFDRQKGVDSFCAAMGKLGDSVHGVMAGGAVVDGTDAVDIPANTDVVGWVNPAQLQHLFETADVLVVPSRWEGFGLIAAEAMRAGLPVVAARVGGLPEVVAQGESGVLFEPGDVDHLVRILRSHSSEALARMGMNGRKRFLERFSIERVHRELAGVYLAVGRGESAQPRQAV
jgi:glycosyltransferase involved in cell wall biosynthesis